MLAKFIKIEEDLCLGCGACIIACIDENTEDIEDFRGYRFLKKHEDFQEERIYNLSLACLHCREAACIEACSQKAIFRDERGYVILEEELCIGCGACMEACPLDAIVEIGGTMAKCNGCGHRIEEGQEPACVRTCLTRALSLTDDREGALDSLVNDLKKYK